MDTEWHRRKWINVKQFKRAKRDNATAPQHAKRCFDVDPYESILAVMSDQWYISYIFISTNKMVAVAQK